jgi:outer membrane murein-binding lipoprotein Lpp
MVKRWPHSTLVAAAIAVVLLSDGCAEKRARAYPWATAITVRPNSPVPVPGYTPPQIDESAPDLPWDFAPPPSLAVSRQPARPRVAVQPAPEPAGSAKTEAPSLAPQLSQQEIAAAQQEMNESLGIAQRNLLSAKNHKLNATQSDLASKVNSFVDESKAAAKDGDWARARNLARKAQLLSDELASSL